MREPPLRLADPNAPPRPIRFPRSAAARRAVLQGVTGDLRPRPSRMWANRRARGGGNSRQIWDLAQSLNCLGFFDDDDDDRPRAA